MRLRGGDYPGSTRLTWAVDRDGVRRSRIEHQMAELEQRRGSARPPGGESMAALQRRVILHLEQFAGQSGTIVIVSHAEPIRAALMYYLAIPLDRFHSVAIDPASISTIRLDGSRRLVSRVNGEVTA